MASLAGLAISIAVLVVAWRTKAKVEEVRLETRTRILKSVLMSRLAEAVQLVDRLVHACDSKTWAEAVFLAGHARRALTGLDLEPFLSAEDCIRLKERGDDLEWIEEALIKKRARRDQAGLHAERRATLSGIANDLIAMERRLWVSSTM